MWGHVTLLIAVQHNKNGNWLHHRWTIGKPYGQSPKRYNVTVMWRSKWRHCNATVTTLWRFCDVTVMLLWRWFDATVMLVWRNCDVGVTQLWRRCDVGVTHQNAFSSHWGMDSESCFSTSFEEKRSGQTVWGGWTINQSIHILPFRSHSLSLSPTRTHTRTTHSLFISFSFLSLWPTGYSSFQKRDDKMSKSNFLSFSRRTRKKCLSQANRCFLHFWKSFLNNFQNIFFSSFTQSVVRTFFILSYKRSLYRFSFYILMYLHGDITLPHERTQRKKRAQGIHKHTLIPICT